MKTINFFSRIKSLFFEFKFWSSTLIFFAAGVVSIQCAEAELVWPAVLNMLVNIYAVYKINTSVKVINALTKSDKNIDQDQIRKNLRAMKKIDGYVGDTANYLILNAKKQFGIQNEIQKSSDETNKIFTSVESKIKEADKISDSVRLQAVQGREAMGKLSTTVGKLEPIQSSMTEFQETLKDIASKLESIDGILFATQLIGFNANIEAARAGEHGRAFSVVANEVGKLAKQIEELSQDIQGKLSNGLDKMKNISQEIKGAVGDSASLIRETKTELELFMTNVTNVLDEIGGAGKSLAQYGELVKTTNTHLEQITKVSNAMGTAAANVRLVQVFIEESVKSVSHYLGDDSLKAASTLDVKLIKNKIENKTVKLAS